MIRRSQSDGLVHKYLPDGTEIGSFSAPHDNEHPRGLAFDGEHLWLVVAHVETLYVVDHEDGSILRTVPLPGLSGDITIMDDHVWATYDEDPYQLAKVVP